MSLEALGTFQKLHNLLGISTAAVLLSYNYLALGNTAEAITYGKQAFDIGLQLRELRAVATGCGSLANVYDGMKEQTKELVFTSICASTMIKYLQFEKLPDAEVDYNIFAGYIETAKLKLGYGEFVRG